MLCIRRWSSWTSYYRHLLYLAPTLKCTAQRNKGYISPFFLIRFLIFNDFYQQAAQHSLASLKNFTRLFFSLSIAFSHIGNWHAHRKDINILSDQSLDDSDIEKLYQLVRSLEFLKDFEDPALFPYLMRGELVYKRYWKRILF